MPKKWSEKTPSENIILLLKYMLQNQRYIPLKELEEKIGISKQSIGKYLERIDLSYFGKLEKIRIGKEVAYGLWISRPRDNTGKKGSLNSIGNRKMNISRLLARLAVFNFDGLRK